MIHKQNLHTHSTYCDGKSTPRETVESALLLGFHSLGFSGHSWMHWSPSYSMSPQRTQEYFAEIQRLKAEYADRLPIYCGIEYDIFSDIDISCFDYAIGSAHYFRIDGQFVGFDRSAQAVEQVIQDWFGGDGMAYAKAYYRMLATLPEYGKFDIIGHFDLITKHSETHAFFDENDPAYLRAALEAAEALRGKIPLFEVNTGAIARGYRTTPYPSLPLLKAMREMGFGAVITSDCHDARMLDCGYRDARERLLACGYREIFILTPDGFVPATL